MRASIALVAIATTAAAAGPLKNFGTGVSAGPLNATETALLDYTLSADGEWGVATHFWITGSSPQVDRATIRYYIDGETTPSIQFLPEHACGVAFGDQDNPWGTKWAGKGSNKGAWFFHYRIPFYKSLRVTYQLAPGDSPGVIYMQVRGVENLPIVLEGVTVPTSGEAKARMVLYKVNKTLAPLEYVDVVSAPSGSQGVLFQVMLSFASPNFNTLEGCVHWYDTPSTPWPGVLVATGTEDYFSSAYYFDLGDGATHFHMPIAGLTHKEQAGSGVTFSAYRFHDMDPLAFSSGGRLQWRNGDTVDAHGYKCFTEEGGRTVGSPGPADMLSYAWWYQW